MMLKQLSMYLVRFVGEVNEKEKKKKERIGKETAFYILERRGRH